MIHAVLLDYDGTLHDTDTAMKRSLDGILGLDGEELYRIYLYDVHRSLIHTKHLDRHDDIMFHCQLLFQVLNKPYDPKIAELICRKLEQAGRDFSNMKFFEDAAPALKMMKEKGIEIYLSTGKYAEEKAKTFEKYAMETFFRGVFSESKNGFLKTEVRYYVESLKTIGRKPEEVASIGDTILSDIKPAKQAGIKTIWVNRRGEPIPQEPDSMPDNIASNLMEATNIIFKV
ncbi:HAD family hydrolase [Candidatus Bathyarchaeota archaeon]|nr:HAD family hydrolase [Candidatus Bathyarchaeota archaeon]MBS7630161.1 HAD family hydrolase [Candidatus Bathyarchaeota archaeon]